MPAPAGRTEFSEERAQRIEPIETYTALTDGTAKIRSGRSGAASFPTASKPKLRPCFACKLWASLLDPDFKHSLHVAAPQPPAL